MGETRSKDCVLVLMLTYLLVLKLACLVLQLPQLRTRINHIVAGVMESFSQVTQLTRSTVQEAAKSDCVVVGATCGILPFREDI